MKKAVVFLLLLEAACSGKLHNENSIKVKPFSHRQLALVYDSLLKHQKDYTLILHDFEEGLLTQTENTSFPREVLQLSSGKLVSFATTNNQKVRDVIGRLPDISPVEILLELRKIEGEIKLQRETLAGDWIKREHFPQLLELAEVDIRMPMITLLSGGPYGSDCILRECLLQSNYAQSHITVGYEALHLMKLYLKVGGGYPVHISNDLELMKAWFNSGLPGEEYKKMLDERMKLIDR